MLVKTKRETSIMLNPWNNRSRFLLLHRTILLSLVQPPQGIGFQPVYRRTECDLGYEYLNSIFSSAHHTSTLRASNSMLIRSGSRIMPNWDHYQNSIIYFQERTSKLKIHICMSPQYTTIILNIDVKIDTMWIQFRLFSHNWKDLFLERDILRNKRKKIYK